MARNILISGDVGSGKTRLLETILSETPGERSGFITKPKIVGDIVSGFEIIASTDVRCAFADVTFTEHRRVGKYGVHVQRFNAILSSLASYSKHSYRPFLYMDEIGALQLVSGIFPYFVRLFLEAPNPFIGTIPHDSVQHKLIDEIKQRPDVTLLELTKDNKEEVYSVVRAFLKGYS